MIKIDIDMPETCGERPLYDTTFYKCPQTIEQLVEFFGTATYEEIMQVLNKRMI